MRGHIMLYLNVEFTFTFIFAWSFETTNRPWLQAQLWRTWNQIFFFMIRFSCTHFFEIHTSRLICSDSTDKENAILNDVDVLEEEVEQKNGSSIIDIITPIMAPRSSKFQACQKTGWGIEAVIKRRTNLKFQALWLPEGYIFLFVL